MEKSGIRVCTGLLEGTIQLSFKVQNEKIAMNMVLKQENRIKIEPLVAVPALLVISGCHPVWRYDERKYLRINVIDRKK